MTELLGQPEHVDFWERAERGEPVAWETLFARYRAGVDYPVARHYRTLSATYPDAKIILTVRDPNKWYESAKSTIYRAEPSLPQKVLLGLQLPFSPRLRKLIRVFRLTGEVWGKESSAGASKIGHTRFRSMPATSKRSNGLYR